MIRCVIIDDEPLARECISDYVGRVEFMQLVGEGSNPMELDQIMATEDVDLIFLDIQMPIINGVDYLRNARNLPKVIFTTAYPSYAIEGYQLDVMEYLLKPITFDRFFQAASKARDYFQQKHNIEPGPSEDNYFFIKCDSKLEKIFIDQIRFIQAMQNYIVIHTENSKFMTLLNMKGMEEKLEPHGFIRVHKSFIISKDQVTGVDNHEVIIGDERIPISRTYRKEVTERIVGDRLW